jgi:hypothetical protein
MAIKRILSGLYFIWLALVIFVPLIGYASNIKVILLDCTQSGPVAGLTGKVPKVYLTRKRFDPMKFSGNGVITPVDFAGLIRTDLIPPKETIRFKTRKNEEIQVYIVTSTPMDIFEQPEAPAAPSLQWVSGPISFVTSTSPRLSGPVTASSQPITLSILKTARLLLKEQERPSSLESGNSPKPSSLFGVIFTDTPPPLGPVERPPSQKLFYYYRLKYKLKFDSGILSLAFEDQNGNQQNVASVVSGPPENWFLMAGGPVYAYNFEAEDFGGNPTGLYIGLNWTPNDIYDPDPRLLIVNILDINTSNPTSAIGLLGLGMGFPKINNFIPLSTLSVTETLAYNLTLSKFQLLTMVNYDVTDVLQLLKL